MDSTVLVAIIGAFGVIGAAAIAARTQIWLKKHVGPTNGEGTISQMMERVLKAQWAMQRQLDEHERTDDRRFHELKKRIDAED